MMAQQMRYCLLAIGLTVFSCFSSYSQVEIKPGGEHEFYYTSYTSFLPSSVTAEYLGEGTGFFTTGPYVWLSSTISGDRFYSGAKFTIKCDEETVNGEYEGVIQVVFSKGSQSEIIERNVVFVVDDGLIPPVILEFATDKKWGENPLPVQFLNLSNLPGNYHWDFGDGEFSTEANPSHIFNFSDPNIAYDVTLTITDQEASYSLKKDKLIVLEKPSWQLNYYIEEGEDNEGNININDVFFINSMQGWAVGNQGLFIRTKDGGQNWEELALFDDNIYLSEIEFIDQNIGYMHGRDFNAGKIMIYKTLNGEDWIGYETDLVPANGMNGIKVINRDTALIGHYITTNGGETLHLDQTYYSHGTIQEIDTGKDGSIWAATYRCILHFNMDQLKWDVIIENWDVRFNTLSVINADLMYAAGRYGHIYKITDEGSNWTLLAENEDFEYRSISFLDQHTGWVLEGGGRCTIFRTDDGGQTWILDSDGSTIPPFNSFYTPLNMIDYSSGWLALYNGLARYTNPNGHYTGTREVALPEASTGLSHIYPNPFVNKTTIEIESVHSEDVAIQIFNSKGQMIKTLFDGHLPSGKHSFQWEPGNLEMGIYHLFVQKGNLVEVKSILRIQ